ncbi:MAG: YbhB/YbcL family Raf kinase inhibitor-like protein [Oscillospiraceae bacterium]|nr:YbhB/YbcL family Raf kinase inhibitor-like protein [Oscillospiraceae bacterium]
MRKIIISVIAAAALVALCGCSNSEDSSVNDLSRQESGSLTSEIQEDFDISKVQNINVTSESINDKGQLLTICSSRSASPKGKNISPQLSWDEISDAGSYAVYMFDKSAGNWLHWMQTDITATTLDENGGKRHYIGPYPPSGKHEYEIVVYALKETPDEYKGNVDQTVNRKDIENALDCYGQKHGNIIAAGSITGTVTNGAAVE